MLLLAMMLTLFLGVGHDAGDVLLVGLLLHMISLLGLVVPAIDLAAIGVGGDVDVAFLGLLLVNVVIVVVGLLGGVLFLLLLVCCCC